MSKRKEVGDGNNWSGRRKKAVTGDTRKHIEDDEEAPRPRPMPGEGGEGESGVIVMPESGSSSVQSSSRKTRVIAQENRMPFPDAEVYFVERFVDEERGRRWLEGLDELDTCAFCVSGNGGDVLRRFFFC
jgi:hypothetical protein